ncbi:hypothetical protein FV222_07030 [Methylobacterium sp. WL103]|uniref:hypothetical protein n=1 Tax=Methylobacterium sp. WL103 TaxID=2603891 RepID=UPI0011CA4222|nr:hypothetical protein [Methylobacterium sp. WL103]TXN04962.1 hypothetical protein FV222_07030 [Methylobacterium sp. WL103]
MIEALETAGAAALDVLHASLLRSKIQACTEAAAGLICFWALPPVERRPVLAGSHADSVALVRIFRNTLESLILVEQLHASAAARRQTIVDRIKAEALGASSMTGGVA